MVEKTEIKLEDETKLNDEPAAESIKDTPEPASAPVAGGIQPDPDPTPQTLPTVVDDQPHVDEATGKLQKIEAAFEKLYAEVQSHLRGRHLAAVEHKLEEAFMWAKQGLSKL